MPRKDWVAGYFEAQQSDYDGIPLSTAEEQFVEPVAAVVAAAFVSASVRRSAGAGARAAGRLVTAVSLSAAAEASEASAKFLSVVGG